MTPEATMRRTLARIALFVWLPALASASATSACHDANSPENARTDDGGAAGSTTPPGDYMSTGHGGLGTPVNEVGADAGLPDIKKH